MVKRSREASPPTSSPSPTSTSDSSPIIETTRHSPPPADTSLHSSKYLQVLPEVLAAAGVMKCSLPPHQETLEFSTFEDFEIHYAKSHANRCSECRRNFPTEHFLGLHIGENHDPLSEARRAKGEKTYSCFVEGCDKICSNPQKRRMHLIDKHLFPKNYDFFIVNSGIDKRSSMLRPRHRKLSSAASRAFSREQKPTSSSSAHDDGDVVDDGASSRGDPSARSNDAAEDSMAGEPSTPPPNLKPQEPTDSDAAMEDLTSTMSTLRFVPPSVRFGRGGSRRGGLSRT